MEMRQPQFCLRVRPVPLYIVVKDVEIVILRAGKIARTESHRKIRVRKAHDELLFIVEDIAFHDAFLTHAVSSFFAALEKLRCKIRQGCFRSRR